MPSITGGKAIVECLKLHGVDTVFGIISTHTMHIYDALYDNKEIIQFIGGRHEHAVGFMADGYSRATGKPGVFFTSGGPGAADSIGAMGEAYHASSSILQITTNIENDLIDKGKGSLHETKDQLGMFKSVTGWNALIKDLSNIPAHIDKAFRSFRTHRPRPIELEIPTDLLSLRTDLTIVDPIIVQPMGIDPKLIIATAEKLTNARRPVILVGSGVMTANATQEVRVLAETLNIPVICSTTGKGAFPDDHVLSLGTGEFGGNRGKSPLADFIPSSDLLIIIGSSMPYARTIQYGLKLPKSVVQIDIDPQEIGKNYPVSLGLIGNAKIILNQLISELRGRSTKQPTSYNKEISDLKTAITKSLMSQFPNEFKTLRSIRDVLSRDAIIVGDATQPVYRAHRCMPVYEPRTYFGPNSWAGLGFGLPAALGAKIGKPSKQVIAMVGDGGFQYNLQELATAVQYGISPVIIVFNDNAWGVLKDIQNDHFNKRVFATELRNPDFCKLADSYGIPSSRVFNGKELSRVLDEALRSGLAHLIIAEMPTGFANFPYDKK